MSTVDSVMVYLNGRDKPSFHCEECGCNVFHHPRTEAGEAQLSTYVCNSCDARYHGE